MRRNVAISERSQIVILWSFVVFTVIYALALGLLLRDRKSVV